VRVLERETLYARLGDWPGWLAAAGLLGLYLADRLGARPR
jgi:hypothetical protein